MRKIEKPKIDIIRFENDDLIVTSGCDVHCKGVKCPDYMCKGEGATCFDYCICGKYN